MQLAATKAPLPSYYNKVQRRCIDRTQNSSKNLLWQLCLSSSVVAVVSGKSVSKLATQTKYWIMNLDGVGGDFESSGCLCQWLLKTPRNNRILFPISFTLTHWNRTLPNDASSPSSPHLTHTLSACFPISLQRVTVISLFQYLSRHSPLQTSHLLSASASPYVTLNFAVKSRLFTTHWSSATFSIFNLLHLSLQLCKNKWGGSDLGSNTVTLHLLQTE